MAAAPKRSVHSVGFFRALNTLSTADFGPERKKKRKTLEGGRLYSVERVVAGRESREVSSNIRHMVFYVYVKPSNAIIA